MKRLPYSSFHNMMQFSGNCFILLVISMYYFCFTFKKKIMKNIDKIKLEAFMEFLKRLGQHKLGECMDIVPINVDYENIKIPKQK